MNHYYVVKWTERYKDGFIHRCERHFDNEQEQKIFWSKLLRNKEAIWICKTTEVIVIRD
jgi:hypothetical protein